MGRPHNWLSTGVRWLTSINPMFALLAMLAALPFALGADPVDASDLDATILTVADHMFFPGLVALINSLRVTGNRYPITVLDMGLSGEQRLLLAPHVTLFACPPEFKAQHPWCIKPFAHLLNPSGVIVMIDSDMIITGNIKPVVDRARAGQICTFPDPNEARWFAGWSESLGLRARLRKGRYMNAGFVAFSATKWREFLERWWTLSSKLAADPGPELQNRDQDVLNALLRSEVPEGSVEELPRSEVVYPWEPLTISDVGTLACDWDGHRSMVLHYDGAGGPKPWQRRSWIRVRRDAYTRLLPRVLLAPDVPIRLGPSTIPSWLHDGAIGSMVLRALSGMNGAASAVAHALPKSLRQRASTLRR